MKHGVKGSKLGVTASHKRAMLRNLTTSLLEHKRITTTLAKAKELRTFVDPIITKAIKGDLNSKRLIMDDLKDKPVVKELFTNIAVTVGDRKGGYTRVVRLGRRRGDAAEMAIIELVDYNAATNEQKKSIGEAREANRDEKNKKNSEKAKALGDTGQ